MMIPSDNVSLRDWAASLMVDFSTTDAIPEIDDETKWKEWGNIVASSPNFASRGVPTTESFPNWQEWGIIVYVTMAR